MKCFNVLRKQEAFTETDEKRTIDTFIKEVRQDKLGRITWEYCDGNE